jgi:hypothetical protein
MRPGAIDDHGGMVAQRAGRRCGESVPGAKEPLQSGMWPVRNFMMVLLFQFKPVDLLKTTGAGV